MAARDPLSQIDRLLASAKEIQLQQSREALGTVAPNDTQEQSLARRRSAQSIPAEPDEDFFGDEVDYEHDELHPSKALSSKPLSRDALIAAHIQSLATLRGDIETMIKKEGRRSFWNGLWTNAIFFALGLVCAAVPLSSGDVFAFLRR